MSAIPMPSPSSIASPKEIAWLLSPLSLPAIVASFSQRAEIPDTVADAELDDETCCGAGGLSMVGPVAVIEISGPIMVSLDRMRAEWYGCTSMDAAVATVRRVCSDETVKGCVVRFNSPGGSVAGSEELIGALAELAGKKPTCALVDRMACSLAMFAAAACGEVVASQNAIVGSIGAIVDLYDFSKAYAAAGVESVAITDQPLKALGIPGQAVTSDMRENLLQLVRDQVGPYMQAFAARRGMKAEDVQAMKGGVYAASRAVQMKLIDRVVSPREFVAAFAARVSTQSPATAINLPTAGGDGGAKSRAPAWKGASMSTDFASMVAGLAPENLDTAAAAVRSNAALFAAVGKAHAEASGLEPKAKPASIGELKAEFKDDMTFVVSALEQGLTMDQAKAQFGVSLRAKLDQANAKIAELQGELAARPNAKALGNPPVPGNDKPAGGGDGPHAKFEARVADHIRRHGGGRSGAVGALLAQAKANPEIQAEYDAYARAIATGAHVEKD